MKTIPLLALTLTLAFASCAVTDERADQTPTATDTAPAIHPDVASCGGTDGADVTESENWDTTKGIGAIWPLNCGWVSVNVLVRKGPPRGSGDLTESHLAFIVYTDAAGDELLGHAYWIYGSDNFTDFEQTFVNTVATRASQLPDYTIGQGGGISGGNPTGPGTPHVDGGIWGYTISSAFVTRAHTSADSFTAGMRYATGLSALK